MRSLLVKPTPFPAVLDMFAFRSCVDTHRVRQRQQEGLTEVSVRSMNCFLVGKGKLPGNPAGCAFVFTETCIQEHCTTCLFVLV
jgi:hypothetical protein